MAGTATGAEPLVARIVVSKRLRIGLFPSFFYGRDPATGAFIGWGIEMARALAAELGVALELVERRSPPDVVRSLCDGEVDAAFLGISAERARHVDFTQPWVKADFTFMVPTKSSIARIEDADRDDVRIAVVRNHAMDAALDGQLPRAARVHADTPDAAFELFRDGAVEVLAGIRPGLSAFLAKAPDARVLDGRYGANVIGLAVAKGEPGWLSLLDDYVARSKSDGTARAAAERVAATGLDVVS
jgi:polar amino acid transport system substrate-binding protein